MSSRLILSWDRCEVCGRHYPTSYCGRYSLWVCSHCNALLACARPAAAVRRPARRGFEPDEDLIEKLSSRATGRRRSRRAAG